MIILKTDKQIELMKIACKVVKETLDEIEKHIKPGISTWELDKIAEDFIRSKGAIPSCKGYYGYPASICASVNDVIVHGIPSKDIILKEGDIISIDLCAFIRGYHGDGARTFAVGKISEEKQKLIDVTKECFFKGLEQVKIGNTIGDIGHAVQMHAEANGFSVIREMVGHGIGKEMHEDPEVPNYGRPHTGATLKEGMVICIEPMVNMGKKDITIDDDDWTCRTKDGKPAAHYENTIAITKNGIEILTIWGYNG